MKRLLLLCMALFVSAASIKAQQQSSVGTPTVVLDTVHYYFNKYYFKTATKLKDFPFYKSAFATTTLVTHIGSKFLNDDTLDITGIEAFITRNASSTKLVIPVHLYLCTLQNNLPVLPPIDSVMLSVSGAETFSAPVGGNFNSGLTHRLTTDYAVLLRNMSLSAGDTVRVARTAGKTHTNVSVPWTEKNSDGFGYVRYNKQFYSATNFTVGGGSTYPYAKSGFGIGTDYEFCIAPRVHYTLTADHAVSANATAPLCTWEDMTVHNLSSRRFMQRQYNLIEFARYWGYGSPLHPNTLMDTITNQPIFPSDSSVGWYFAPEDNLQNHPYPVFFLPYNTPNNQMIFQTDSSSYDSFGGDSTTCFTTNEFRTRYKTMAIYGRGQYLLYNDTFQICTSYCGRPWVNGVSEQSVLRDMKLYPNPSSGKAIVTGLNGTFTLRVYDVVGQLIREESINSEKVEIDLTQNPPGTYFIKVDNGQESRVMRFIRN